MHHSQREHVPQAPRVLSVMFLHSDPSLLPLLGDLVQDLLLALDLSYDHRAPLFCCVLHSLLKALGEDARTGALDTVTAAAP